MVVVEPLRLCLGHLDPAYHFVHAQLRDQQLLALPFPPGDHLGVLCIAGIPGTQEQQAVGKDLALNIPACRGRVAHRGRLSLLGQRLRQCTRGDAPAPVFGHGGVRVGARGRQVGPQRQRQSQVGGLEPDAVFLPQVCQDLHLPLRHPLLAQTRLNGASHLLERRLAAVQYLYYLPAVTRVDGLADEPHGLAECRVSQGRYRVVLPEEPPKIPALARVGRARPLPCQLREIRTRAQPLDDVARGGVAR